MMHLRGALAGIVAFLAVVAGAVIAVCSLGYAPVMADRAPSALEANLAMTALHATSEREMGARANPVPDTPEKLAAGLKLYEKNCLICHGASDGKPSVIAAGFYIPAPQFAADGAEDDPEGATFWKIQHGIRFSAMPAFAKGLSDAQMWQLTLFLKHMDRLPKGIESKWKAVTSVGGGAPAQKM